MLFLADNRVRKRNDLRIPPNTKVTRQEKSKSSFEGYIRKDSAGGQSPAVENLLHLQSPVVNCADFYVSKAGPFYSM